MAMASLSTIKRRLFFIKPHIGEHTATVPPQPSYLFGAAKDRLTPQKNSAGAFSASK